MIDRFPICLACALSLCLLKAGAQDSLLHRASARFDSTYINKSGPLDSLQKNFQLRSDSVQKTFASPLSKLHSQIGLLTHKKDSLSRLGLSTQSVSHRIDSLQNIQTLKAKELQSSIAKIKKQTLSKIPSLNLPPQAQGEIDQLSKSIGSYSVPSDFFQLPNMSVKMPGLNSPALSAAGINIPATKIPSLNLPSNFNIPSTNIPSLQKVDIKNIAQLPSLEKYKNELAQVNQLKSKMSKKELKNLALKEAGQVKELKALQDQNGKLAEMKNEMAKAKDAKPEQLQQMAVNHFAGKEQQLKSAMDQVSKYKQKYSSVKSLAELPKRPPNPLKGKPWYERTLFGVNYFVMNKDYVMVDFNPYATWKFTPHLSASIGWNERIGISHWNFHTNQFDRVFGLRTAVNYTWTRGIVFKIAPEVMNAWIPTNGNLDQKQEAAVWSLYAGVRKDFPIYKKIRGYSEVLYNFTQSPGKNIYGDPVSFRVGIETSFQKKPKKGQSNVINAASILDQYKDKFKIRSPKDSFQIFSLDQAFGVISIKGDTLIKPQFASIEKFMKKTSLYFIVSKNEKFGAVDNKGRMVLPVEKSKARQVKSELIKREIEYIDFNKVAHEIRYYQPK